MSVVIQNFKTSTTLLKGEKRKLYNLINKIIADNNKVTGSITIILTSKEYLLKINKKFLNHNYHTDIVTFNYNEKNVVSGDLFISLPKIIENASIYKTSKKDELIRVIFHGILHLLDYNDKSNEEILIMRQKENYYLKKYFT